MREHCKLLDETYVMEAFSATPAPPELEPAVALSPHKTNRVQLFPPGERLKQMDRRVGAGASVRSATRTNVAHSTCSAAAAVAKSHYITVPPVLLPLQYGGGSEQQWQRRKLTD
jgi:hypothetical protein